MDKSKKNKIIIGLFYLILVSFLVFLFFSKFSFEEINNYKFIQTNREYFFELKKNNLILLSFIYLIITIFWIFVAGFGTPVALLAGFIFGKWLGTFILVIGMTIGATLLYIFGNYFLKNFIKEKFLNNFIKLESKFKKSEFNYLLLYRFVGGIPFAIANLLPILFNVRIKNYFWSTLIGIIPGHFLIVSLGSGLENAVEKNQNMPKITELIYSPEIYIPLTLFIVLIFASLILKKILYKN
tara:strand:+ start:69 stop:788 length:720 start_codon:yes stop_codon:yes gene_type:complete